MGKKTLLQKGTEDFILARKKGFTFRELSDALVIPGKKKNPEKEILDILETDGLVFSRDFDRFMPRHVYFQGARFMVSPTETEVKSKILIPGHRFIPFCSRLTHPWECVITVSDAEVPRKTVKEKVRDILTYFSLFGREHLPAIIAADRPSNSEVLRPEDFADSVVEITAFDFSAVFGRWKFSFGDGLIFTVKDWTRGIFTAEYIPKNRRLALMKSAADWTGKFEKGFLKTFDDLGLNFPMEEQVAYAYYYAGKTVLSSPPIHLGGFINSSTRVNFVDVGTETRLWSETHIDPSVLKLPDAAEPSGATGSLDAIFRDLGITLSETEVEAYMRDELFRRNEDPGRVLERIFEERSTEFFSEEQMNDFVRYFEKLWGRVKRSYNYFADQQTGRLRGRILEILDRQIDWLRGLDRYRVEAKDLPVQEMTSAAQSTAFLVEYLKLLNKKSSGSPAEIQETLELLPQIDSSLEDLRERIEEHLDDFLPETEQEVLRELRLVKPGPVDKTPPAARPRGTKHVFVLKVALMDIRPPIWRRIQVPGDFTLEDLHNTIQNAMGWDGYHAHSFIIDGAYYSPPAEEDGIFGTEDRNEEDHTLDGLELKERGKFRYIYDFGDSWTHQITVEKVLSLRGLSGEDKTSSRCLAGKRACPPEDCGGVPGYEEILEAVKSPFKKRYRERLDWLGDFDPEYFDIDAANRRLRGEST